MHHRQPISAHRRVSPALSIAVAGLMIVGLTACSVASTSSPTVSSSVAATSSPPASSSPSTVPVSPGSSGASATRLIVEPDQGMTPIYSVLASPTRSLDLSMYELVDTRAESLLAADAARGVTVRVILDHRREATQNQPALSYLAAHRVQVEWAPPPWPAFHLKMICVDDATCWVLTLNLTSRYYANTRDLAVSDADPADVAAMEGTFTADFDGSSAAAAGTDLVWSPGSAAGLTSLIASATSELLIYNEEMSDPAIVASLASAARRGVDVKVVMTDAPSWAPDFSLLAAAGVQVRLYQGESPIYIHAKMISVDQREVFVGSENFSRASLDDNRELGVVVSDVATVSSADRTFAVDFAGARPWAG
jgi:cardiolipin synthase